MRFSYSLGAIQQHLQFILVLLSVSQTLGFQDDKLEPADSEAGEDVGINVGAVGSAEQDGIEGEGKHVGNEAGEHLNHDRYVHEVEVSEMGESRVKEEGKAMELEEHDGWPKWPRDVVNMLWAGEQGKEMELNLIRLIKIQMCLGFKGEKTVRFKFTFMGPHTKHRTYTGRHRRQRRDQSKCTSSWPTTEDLTAGPESKMCKNMDFFMKHGTRN